MKKSAKKASRKKASRKSVLANASKPPAATEPDLSIPELQALPPEQREVIVAQFKEQYHSGPLPPPEQLADYGSIIPDGAERIMIMAERQSAHRIEMEASLAAADIRLQERGQNYALVVTMGLIISAIVLGVIGHPALGAVVVGFNIVGLVTAFIVGRKR